MLFPKSSEGGSSTPASLLIACFAVSLALAAAVFNPPEGLHIQRAHENAQEATNQSTVMIKLTRGSVA